MVNITSRYRGCEAINGVRSFSARNRGHFLMDAVHVQDLFLSRLSLNLAHNCHGPVCKICSRYLLVPVYLNNPEIHNLARVGNYSKCCHSEGNLETRLFPKYRAFLVIMLGNEARPGETCSKRAEYPLTQLLFQYSSCRIIYISFEGKKSRELRLRRKLLHRLSR